MHPRTRRELASGILTRGENTLAPGQQKPASLRQDAPQPPLDRIDVAPSNRGLARLERTPWRIGYDPGTAGDWQAC